MRILLTLLLVLASWIAYSQSGVGYLNYTVYNIYPNGAGQYANSATDFVNMFDVTKGATVYVTGTSTAQKTLYFQNGWQPSNLPNGGSYTGIKITGYFVPKETGTYTFGIDGDDGVDFSLDGNVVTSFYGGHGFQGYRYGSVSLVAGKTYTFMARYQNWGGGWGMFLLWKRPSQTQYSIQTDEVYSTKPAEPTKKANATFNLNNLDATKFSVNSNSLTSLGLVDITTSLDSIKVANGYNIGITAGQVEWSYVNFFNGATTLYVDMRQFGNITPSSVNSVSLLDVYSGPVTFNTSDGTWAQYSVPSTLPKVVNGTSSYNSNIRNAGFGNYAFSSTIAFSSNLKYKPQTITLTTTNNLTTLYGSIITISDVYSAFKELSSTGILGTEKGNEFTYGIQYKNADVDDNEIFDESDCFKLLQHLMGTNLIIPSYTLGNTARLISTDTYNKIGKSTWNTFTTPLSSTYTFDINTGNATDNISISVAWKGDVNLSHSTTPLVSALTTTSTKVANLSLAAQIESYITTEIINNKVYANITLDPLGQELVGTQYQLNYDNTILKFEKVEFITNGNPVNFGVGKDGYVNLGSLVTDGSTTLGVNTQYRVIFTPLTSITNVLGLMSMGVTDAVNKSGQQLKVLLR